MDRDGTDGEPLPFLGGGVPAAFELRTVAIPAGASRAYDEAEWEDAIVVLESGELEVECVRGGRRRFERGAVMYLVGLALRTLHNLGPETAVLVAVSRRAGHPAPAAAEVAGVRPSASPARRGSPRDSVRGILSEPLSVILVEDSLPMRRLLVAYLERQDELRVVGVAETGEEFRALIEEQVPDAVVLDLGLPDSRGLDLLLHTQAPSPTTAVVVFSGDSVSRRGGAMTMLGADAFIEKPDIALLHRTIVAAVARRRRGFR
jgi:CheY-like chemotaxis protein